MKMKMKMKVTLPSNNGRPVRFPGSRLIKPMLNREFSVNADGSVSQISPWYHHNTTRRINMTMTLREIVSKSKAKDLKVSGLSAENRYRVALALRKVLKFEGVKDAVVRRDAESLSKLSNHWWNFYISSYDATDFHLEVSDAMETLSTFFEIGGVLNINTNNNDTNN